MANGYGNDPNTVGTGGVTPGLIDLIMRLIWKKKSQQMGQPNPLEQQVYRGSQLGVQPRAGGVLDPMERRKQEMLRQLEQLD